MRAAWFVLLISASTDFIINAGTGLMSAMMASGNAAVPNKAILILCFISGIVAASRTIQQALKQTPETSAALRGDESHTKTEVIQKTP